LRNFSINRKKRFLINKVTLTFKLFNVRRQAVEMSSETYSMEKEQVLESLNTTEKGLTTQEAEKRLTEYGQTS